MKKLLLVIIFCPTLLLAQYIGPDSSGDNTIKDLLEKPVDDIYVTLRGHITKKVGFKKYMFSDGTGEIRVDIDEGEFPKEPITPYTMLEINGNVERKFVISPEIDVKWVRLISEKELLNQELIKEKKGGKK
jgi:uncharacterized protein (TIGR00156 family)